MKGVEKTDVVGMKAQVNLSQIRLQYHSTALAKFILIEVFLCKSDRLGR
jgi:hypothetical protein